MTTGIMNLDASYQVTDIPIKGVQEIVYNFCVIPARPSKCETREKSVLSFAVDGVVDADEFHR